MKKILLGLILWSIFAHADKVPLSLRGGVYHTPVTLNDSVRLEFVVDSGAAMVLLPADVYLTLIRTGTIQESDILGKGKAETANGEVIETTEINIKKLQIGNKVIRNVRASVSGVSASLLLGQSALKKLEPWSINTSRKILSIGSNHTYQNDYRSYASTSLITRKEILSFIDKYISRGNSRDVKGVMSLYADRVDYYRAGPVSKRFIYQDKLKYYKRWPSMQVEFLGIDNIEDVSGYPNEKIVTYSIYFDVYNYLTKKGIKGEGTNTIILRKENGKLEIISDKQKVSSRKKY